MHAISLDTSKSTQVSTAKKRSAPLDPQVADRLLDLLSTDDAFRKLFMRDPRAALDQVGFVNTTDLPSPTDCFWPPQLASKTQIAAARDEIRIMLTSGLAQTPPQLDANVAASRHLRK
jgi:putative modified peptide